MIPKISKVASTFFRALVVSVMLLVAAASQGFAQAVTEPGGRLSAEAGRLADEAFQEARRLIILEQRDAARLRLLDAMRLWTEARAPDRAAQAALEIGALHRQAGRYAEALAAYRLAREVKALPGALRMVVFRRIARIYAELFVSELAIRYYSKALQEARALKDSQAQALTHVSLAEQYYQQEKRQQAALHLTLAQQLSGKAALEANPQWLYLWASLAQAKGLTQSARGAFEKALTLFSKLNDGVGQIQTLCALSRLSLLVMRKEEALALAAQAVALADKEVKGARTREAKGRAKDGQWRALLSQARAARALGEREQASQFYQHAANQYELVFWNVHVASEVSSLVFREEGQALYREFASLLIELGRHREAYINIETAKAKTLLNWASTQQMRQPVEDRQLTAQQRQALHLCVLLQQQLRTAATRRESQRLQTALEEAQYQAFELQLDTEIATARDRTRWADLATTEQWQTQSAEQQLTLVQFSLGESQSFVWMFAGGEVFWRELPSRQDLEREVMRYVENLAKAPDPWHGERWLTALAAQAESLFASLFGDLSDRLAPGRLIIIPDGLLHYLPFEALMRNRRYLLEDHEISYAPSASLLKLWQQSADTRTDGLGGEPMELLAVGDPAFAAPARPRVNQRGQPLFAVRGFQLAPLPNTKDEILGIVGMLPTAQSRVLLGEQGTEAAFKGEFLRRYRRLHFATHSLIDEKLPSRSALVLTPDDDTDEDGLLEVNEIARLRLDCDLVIISACQTGRGKLLVGEGILGFGRAFLRAGARAVIVSLWNVSDQSASSLMKTFYQNLTAGSSQAAALRQAKLQMLRSGKNQQQPYYWASFVMIGKP